MFERVIETRLSIDASPQAVWDVLVDLPAYAEWNPFVVEGKRPPRAGGSVDIVVAFGDKRFPTKAKVRNLDEPRRFSWGGGLPVLVDLEHYFEIEERDGGCVLVHGERFKGLLSPVVTRALGATEAPYHALNQALADRVAQIAASAAS